MILILHLKMPFISKGSKISANRKNPRSGSWTKKAKLWKPEKTRIQWLATSDLRLRKKIHYSRRQRKRLCWTALVSISKSWIVDSILYNDLILLVPDLYFKPSAYTAVLFTGKRKNYKHLILNTSAIMQCNNSHVIILIIIINPYMTRGLALGPKKT